MNYANLSKDLPRGDFRGRPALVAVLDKINRDDPFEMEQGPDKVLRFIDRVLQRAFEQEDLTAIERYNTQRRDFFFNRDDPNETFKINALTRTPEFGGLSGGTSPGDPHELMTAALILHYGQGSIRRVPTSSYSDTNSIISLANNAKGWASNVQGTIDKKQEKIDIFDEKLPEMAMAISAANGFLKNLETSSRVVNVWATGQVWPQILRRYRKGKDAVSRHLFFGEEDYNSSDLVVEIRKSDRNVFVGVSLKKKGVGNTAADPTMVNKTVLGQDGLLKALVKNGYINAYNDYREIYKIRAQFFYDVIEEALTRAPLRERNAALNKLIRNQTVPQYLTDLRRNISTVRRKSQLVLRQAARLGQNKMTPALMQKWPHADRNLNIVNEYYIKLHEMLTDPDNARAIVTALANIIFKTDLMPIIEHRGPMPEFKFTLLTGKGAWTERNGPQVRTSAEMQEQFTSSIVADALASATKQNAFKVETPSNLKNAWEDGSNAAKIFFKIWMGTLDLCDMEIRYKGSITAEPQFQATITPNFKRIYKRVTRGGNRHDNW